MIGLIKIVFADPPDELSITGYKQGEILQEGSLRRIKCTALSGNPLPELEWFAGNKKVGGAKLEKAESGAYVSLEISIKVDRSDNGKSYKCQAKSEASEEPFRKSVALKVSFPPRRVKVEVEPESPIVGKPAVLKCLTDSSNPDTQILWWYNGEQIHGSDSQTKVGIFGGSISSSLLHIDVTEAHINAEYKCEARHAATSKSISNTTKIGVQCEYSQCQFIQQKLNHSYFQINHNSLMYLKKLTLKSIALELLE